MAFDLKARPEGESKGVAPHNELLVQLVLASMRQTTCKRSRARHMSEGALQIGALCEQLLGAWVSPGGGGGGVAAKPAPIEQLAADLERLGQGRASACATRWRELARAQREVSRVGGGGVAVVMMTSGELLIEDREHVLEAFEAALATRRWHIARELATSSLLEDLTLALLERIEQAKAKARDRASKQESTK